MSVPINIPKLGVSMTEGTLVEWLVSDGDQVSEGQPLYVIETDKVENEVEATAPARCGSPARRARRTRSERRSERST